MCVCARAHAYILHSSVRAASEYISEAISVTLKICAFPPQEGYHHISFKVHSFRSQIRTSCHQHQLQGLYLRPVSNLYPDCQFIISLQD